MCDAPTTALNDCLVGHIISCDVKEGVGIISETKDQQQECYLVQPISKDSRLFPSIKREGFEQVMMTRRDRILLLSSIVQLTLFVPIAWWARKHQQPPIEISLSRLVQKNQRSFVRSAILVVNTLTGSSVFLNLLVAPVAAIMWMRRRRLEAVVTLVSCWTSVLVRTLIKQTIHRPRPHFPFVRSTKKSRGKSFPSGHVVSSMNLWGWLLALGLLNKHALQSGRSALMTLAALCVGITGPSRIYLGDHWVTDVLGGYLFGGGWLGLTLYSYLHLRERGILIAAQEQGREDILSSHW